ARVLVEVSAEDDLPIVIEIEYPPLGNRPSRIGILEDAINVNGSGVTVSSSDLNDGFVFVGKKNKPVISQNRSAPGNYNKSNFYGMRGEGVDNGKRKLAGNQKQYGNGLVFNDYGNFRRNIQGNNA
nr:hypothetical protein [Tanacetum cinerariifolium]